MSAHFPEPIHNIFPSTSLADAKKDPLLFLGPTFIGLTILCLILHQFFLLFLPFSAFLSGQYPNAGLIKGGLSKSQPVLFEFVNDLL